MRLKNLIADLKKCKPNRKEYYIEPKVRFNVDEPSLFLFLPTIVFVPWIYRYNGMACCEIAWLNLHIGIGIWRRKDGGFDGEYRNIRK